MIFVHSHVVECVLDRILDLLQARISLALITSAYPDDLALCSRLNFELLLNQLCQQVTVAWKLFDIYLYH